MPKKSRQWTLYWRPKGDARWRRAFDLHGPKNRAEKAFAPVRMAVLFNRPDLETKLDYWNPMRPLDNILQELQKNAIDLPKPEV